ncbi:MAG: hypothetical protein LPJ89_07910 [Hymenobacteraceae bacterium]|nr:hypothetical protein [Hymenobacteraceae bacterium]
MSYLKTLVLITLLIVTAVTGARAQEPIKKLHLKQRMLNDSIIRTINLKPEPVIDFPNVNKIPFYENKKKLREIRKYEKRKDWKKVRPLLEEYVRNFGIENFYKNTNMLWRLAQLLEREQKSEKAKAFYRLALKHHRSDISQIQQYYDSLEHLNKDYYVPLKHYYELVEYRKTISTLKPPKVFT